MTEVPRRLRWRFRAVACLVVLAAAVTGVLAAGTTHAGHAGLDAGTEAVGGATTVPGSGAQAPATDRRQPVAGAGLEARLVATVGGLPGGWRWLVGAAAPLAFVVWFLRRSLPLNRPADASGAGEAVADGGTAVHGTLGLANGLTVLRGWLFAGVAGFLLFVPAETSAWRWVPALWYGVGVALDWLDGTVARTLSRQTELGRRLDLAFDTMGFLVAPLVGVVWGALPGWYLGISVARYLFRLGCRVRRWRGLPVGDLPESRLRRPLAALQMVVVTVALVPATPAAVVWPVATLAMLPSLAVFGRDYLAVTGRLG